MVPRSADDKPRGPAAPEPKIKGTADEGGTPWTAFTLDEGTGTLYVPGGNPSSSDDVSFSVALDPKTGAIKQSYLPVKHDFHDWEVSAAPVLFTANGKKMLAQSTKDGRIYAGDISTAKPAWTANTTTVSNEGAPLTKEGTHVCPGTLGGNEWSNPAYSPRTNLLYNGAVDWCTTLSSTDTKKPKSTPDPVTSATGWIKAFNSASGKEAWSFHTPSPIVAGLTPTAGNVLFAGDLAGNLYAFNAATGAVVWKTNTGGAIAGSVLSYSIAGKQRIAATAGMKSNTWPMASGTPAIVIYASK